MRQCLAYVNTICDVMYRRWTRTEYLVGMITVAILLSAALSSRWQPEASPKLIIDESVAGDFQALAVETWDRFLTVFQARATCFGDVRLHTERTLRDRAVYDPKTATVTVRVPGTPAMLQGALVHEWAHHLEFQCEAHEGLRQPFLAAQGLPLDTPWRPDNTPVSTLDNTWSEIPSEQYAEATIELVLGRRQIPTKIRVTQEAVHVIEVWAADNQRSEQSIKGEPSER